MSIVCLGKILAIIFFTLFITIPRENIFRNILIVVVACLLGMNIYCLHANYGCFQFVFTCFYYIKNGLISIINFVPSCLKWLIWALLFILLFLFFRVKQPYESAIKHKYMMLSLLFFAVSIIFINKNFDEIISNILWDFFNVTLMALLYFLFSFYERKIKRYYEDGVKLTDDYNGLVKKYKDDNEHFVKIPGDNTKVITLPIINMGEGSVRLNDNSSSIVIIKDDKGDQYKLPEIISQNFTEIMNVHSESEIYNRLCIRVKSMYLEGDVFNLTTGRTMYFDSLVTNRASDFNFGKGLSVRNLFETGPKMSSLEKSRLSNHLEFNGFVESSDGYIVFVKRSDDVSMSKHTYGDSIGASLKTDFALNKNGEFTRKGLKRAILEEINKELKIKKDDLDLDALCIFAAYRDCVESGKPQFLMYVKSTLDKEEITKNFENKLKEERCKYRKESNNSIFSYSYKPKHKLEQKKKKVEVDGKNLIWIKKTDLCDNIVYKINCIHCNGEIIKGKGKKCYLKKIKMVPSALAAVYLFTNYIKKYELADKND